MKKIQCIVSILTIAITIINIGVIVKGKIEEHKQEQFIEQVKQEINQKEETDTSIEESSKSEVIEQKQEQEVIEQEQKEVSKQEEVTQKKEQSVQVKEETTSVIENNTKEEVANETTAWGELGITEYEYYNSPMWKWARVDFKVSDYGNAEETIKACRSYGDEMMKKGLGFSCTSINSYAGNYLGEMFKTF